MVLRRIYLETTSSRRGLPTRACGMKFYVKLPIRFGETPIQITQRGAGCCCWPAWVRLHHQPKWRNTFWSKQHASVRVGYVMDNMYAFITFWLLGLSQIMPIMDSKLLANTSSFKPCRSPCMDRRQRGLTHYPCWNGQPIERKQTWFCKYTVLMVCISFTRTVWVSAPFS